MPKKLKTKKLKKEVSEGPEIKTKKRRNTSKGRKFHSYIKPIVTKCAEEMGLKETISTQSSAVHTLDRLVQDFLSDVNQSAAEFSMLELYFQNN